MAKKKKPNKELQSKLIVPGAESAPKTQLLVPEGEVGKSSQLLVPEGEVGKSTARLAVPGADGDSPAPKPTLIVEGGAPPDVAAEEGEAADQFTVINEDTGESVVVEAKPVKVTAMVPPAEPEPEPEPEPGHVEAAPAAESDVVEEIQPVVAVAMSAPSALVEEDAVPVAEGGATEEEPPAEEVQYEQPLPEEGGQYEQPEYAQETYQQPEAEQAADQGYAAPADPYAQQQEYYDPNQHAQVPAPAPVAAPGYAPPPLPSFAPPPQAPPHPHAHPQPYGYGAPPMAAPGYPPQPGMVPGMYPGQGGFAPQRNVPGWALVLVGVLTGFLLAMVIFKFTGMGAALRGDLIEETRKAEKKKYDAKIKKILGEDEPDRAEEDEDVEADEEPDPEAEEEKEPEPEEDDEAEE